ncbi:MAG TPA: GntR family transcriptional regulator [Bacillota bacterium]|jgi:DNA-binding transcriptional regulator YhcF (GntR family)|nr:GntR family transcriptional regulator [Bacillota bacterium]HPZ64092.1 GntR family transcriptional regulator [Bacillota bacterium]HQD06103.1 GntR family transcriptional regulator [Bacillota bacterium]
MYYLGFGAGGGSGQVLNGDSLTPIYVQVAEWLETEILNGNLRSNERVYSQYQLADMFNINPATAAKGLNILADQGLVYKKRGLGMFVSPRAGERIRRKRINRNLKRLAQELAMEAERLGVSREELLDLIAEAWTQARKEELE